MLNYYNYTTNIYWSLREPAMTQDPHTYRLCAQALLELLLCCLLLVTWMDGCWGGEGSGCALPKYASPGPIWSPYAITAECDLRVFSWRIK